MDSKIRKKLNISIILLIVVLVFMTGAVCTNCQDDKDDSQKIDIDPSDSEEVEPEDIADVETDEDEEEEPTLELEIYEGPLYSEPDDLCFYRIEAVIEGFEEPISIKFSKDDSKGSWGENIAQVNLERGQRYTLEVTVSDDKTEKKESIDLEWQCDEDTPEGEIVINNSPIISSIIVPSGKKLINTTIDIAAVVIDPEGDELSYKWIVGEGNISDSNKLITRWTLPGTPGDYILKLEVQDSEGNISSAEEKVSVTSSSGSSVKEKNLVSEQSGSISLNGTIDNSRIKVGHMSDGKDYSGYLSFDITDLYNKNISNATLFMSTSDIWEPKNDLGDLMLGGLDFGNTPLNASISTRPAELIAVFSNNTTNIEFSSNSLVNKLKSRIDSGSSRMQIKIYYQYPNAYTGSKAHGLSFDPASIIMRVEYTG